jgi:polyhydroxyalkanoate synthesis repressor PhaR
MTEVQPKVIKRYSNRKLYDTERSCYVTLDEISRMVKEGVEVKIIDNKTKEDLTTVTLTQIIFAEEKKQRSILPLATLREIIQTGGESISEFFHKTIAEPVTHFTEGAGKKMDKIFKRADGDPAPPEAERREHGTVREWFDLQRTSLEEWQHRVEESMRDGLANLTSLPKIRIELERIRGRMEDLESRISKLEQR